MEKVLCINLPLLDFTICYMSSCLFLCYVEFVKKLSGPYSLYLLTLLYLTNHQTFRYINQIRDLINRGAPVNGIGAQGHFGPNSIDLGKVENAFNKLWSNFKFPIW
jgi:hypothetical protein